MSRLDCGETWWWSMVSVQSLLSLAMSQQLFLKRRVSVESRRILSKGLLWMEKRVLSGKSVKPNLASHRRWARWRNSMEMFLENQYFCVTATTVLLRPRVCWTTVPQWLEVGQRSRRVWGGPVRTRWSLAWPSVTACHPIWLWRL